MKDIPVDTALRTVTIYECDYNISTLIAKKNGLLNEKGKASMRDVFHFLVQNFGDKIA
jgi:hypothetical protein